MEKYMILTDGIKLDGVELESGSVTELPWQIGDNYTARGWAKKAGEEDDTDISRSEKISKGRRK